MKVAVVGAGNFGTAIANIVAQNGFPTYLWMRDAAQLAEMRQHRENRRYLKGHPLDPNVVPSGDLAEAVGDSDMIFVTVPSASFRQVTGTLPPMRSGARAQSAGPRGWSPMGSV